MKAPCAVSTTADTTNASAAAIAATMRARNDKTPSPADEDISRERQDAGLACGRFCFDQYKVRNTNE